MQLLANSFCLLTDVGLECWPAEKIISSTNGHDDQYNQDPVYSLFFLIIPIAPMLIKANFFKFVLIYVYLS